MIYLTCLSFVLCLTGFSFVVTDTDNQRNEGIDEVLGDTQDLYVNITHPQPYKEFLRHPDNSMDTDEPIYVNTVFK